VVDVDSWMRSAAPVATMAVIDLQERFCRYSFRGASAEFVTNRTLAVAMHRDGEAVAHLYEITTDGRMVRQITR
jgi:hypothetical protein